MRRPGGYARLVDPDRGTIERDTFTCAHCNRIVHVKPLAPPEDLGGWCRQCSKPICSTCAAKRTCLPFEKWLEKVESEFRLKRQI